MKPVLTDQVPGKGSDFTKAMKSHGVAKGDGKNKRHPATSHYGMGPAGNKYGKR